MLISIRFLYFLFLNFLLKSVSILAQLDDSLLLPDLTIDLPIRKFQFSAQTGSILQCDLQKDLQSLQNDLKQHSITVQWLFYSFLEQRFVQLEDSDLLKQINTINENYLSFLPFTSDQYNANIHNNYFRCLLSSDKYKVAGQVVKVKACKYFCYFF